MIRSVSLTLGFGLVLALSGCGESGSNAGVDSEACDGVQAEIQEIEMGIEKARETAWRHQVKAYS